MRRDDTGSQVAAETIGELTNRVYGLCGGHIQPIWDDLVDTGTDVVDVRDERAAVHAAQASAEVSGGLGVALVTSGPGFTNALTGVANASTTGTPLLVVTGRPPMPQFERGALQELPQREMAKGITAMDRTVFEADRIRGALVEAAGAALDERAPVLVEIPTDVLREDAADIYDRSVPTGANDPPASESALDRAADALREADRPVAILGRGARDATSALAEFLERAQLPALTTGGSKGTLTESNDLSVPGARGVAMNEADAYLLFGKRLDFAVGYGSPAVFGDGSLIQVDVDAEALRRNRTPDVAVRGTVSSAAAGLSERVTEPLADPQWLNDLQETHVDRVERMDEQKRADEKPIHPYRVCGAIERALGADAVVVCDGGDALSFGRVGISATNSRGYLDPGPLGCLGVGVPFAIGAALERPEADVVTFTGDGSLGFNLADIETAVREDADITVVVANNSGWNIERYDQVENYGREVGVNLRELSYDELAEQMGATGFSVADPATLDEAVETAVEIDGPAVVDVQVDPDVVSPDARNGLARVPNYQPLEPWDERERELRNDTER